MKTSKFILTIAGMAYLMAFSACSSDEAELQTVAGSNVIKLTSVLNQTRSTIDPQATVLNTTNSVGVFVTNDGNVIENGDNNAHSVESNGILNTTSEMTYPLGQNQTVNIYAYAPYAKGFQISSANEFSVAEDQSTDAGYIASDLVFSKEESVSKTDAAVSLTFDHMLSQMQINIEYAENADIDLEKANVYVCGTKVTTTLNLSTGTLGDATGDTKEIKVGSSIGDTKKLYAVLVPQTIAANTELVKITTNSSALATPESYVARLETEATLEKGHAYSFTVKIEEDKVTVNVDGTSINAWTNPTELGSDNGGDIEDPEDPNETPDTPDPEDPEEEPETETTSLYATFGTPASSASYDSDTYTYTWEASSNNLMTCFTFSDGELANYSTLYFTVSELSSSNSPYRVNILFSDNTNMNTNSGYYSDGKKEIDLTTLDLTVNGTSHTLADVTSIRFGGYNGTGSLVIKATEMYLE